MRPEKKPEAFHTGGFAELVCSNSLRSDSLNNAVGILKEEMRQLDSLIMTAADANRVPAGSALAVDRTGFSGQITRTLKNHPLVTVVTEEVTSIPDGPVIIATGPLTAGALAEDIKKRTGTETFHFYDAAAPIVEKDSIDFSKAYYKSRYDKGDADYINCAMDQTQFDAFYEALTGAQCAQLHDFEKDLKVFEGCMPIEEMARRGKKDHAVRTDETCGSAPGRGAPGGSDSAAAGRCGGYTLQHRGISDSSDLAGAETCFSMIPGLENARFVRYGVMHRNSYLPAKEVLQETYQSRLRPDLFCGTAHRCGGI